MRARAWNGGRPVAGCTARARRARGQAASRAAFGGARQGRGGKEREGGGRKKKRKRKEKKGREKEREREGERKREIDWRRDRPADLAAATAAGRARAPVGHDAAVGGTRRAE